MPLSVSVEPTWTEAMLPVLRITCALALTSLPAVADPADAALRLGGSVEGMNCTAVLVAPDAALTAGHCARGTPDLFADWSPGGGARLETVARQVPRLSDTAENRFHADQLRLTLARPTGIAPLPIDAPPATGEVVRVLSWPRGATRMRDATCTVLARPGREMLLDCPAETGMSGAPVLAWRVTEWRVVGILTSRVGTTRSLATAVARDLR